MDARIGAAGARRFDGPAEQQLEGRLHVALHGELAGLPGEP